MPIKDCIVKLQGIRPEMKDKILSYKEKYLKEGMDERKAEIKAVESYGKDLHDRLNKLKKAVDIKQDVYKPYDSTEKKKVIEEKYSELEKQQSDQPITSSIKTEQNGNKEGNQNANGEKSTAEQSQQRSEIQNGESREGSSQKQNDVTASKEGAESKTAPSSKEKDLVTPSVESIKVFDAVEKADRSKISQREKTKAVEEAMSEFGEMGKKAMEINKDFENIVAELKRQNKLEVKC